MKPRWKIRPQYPHFDGTFVCQIDRYDLYTARTSYGYNILVLFDHRPWALTIWAAKDIPGVGDIAVEEKRQLTMIYNMLCQEG